MSKVTLAAVGSLQDTTTAASTINANTSAIVTAWDNNLSRDGTQPNQMEANLDMNSNHIINLPSPISANEPLRLQDASILNGGGTITTIPLGGTTGQVLEKNSSTNFDVSWQTLPTPSAQATTARQAILSGSVDGAGFPNYAAPGSGLNANLMATTTPLVLSFAGGYNSTGPLDYPGYISSDVTPYWTNLPANQYSFLSIDRNTGNGALTATQTLIRPQRGPSFYTGRQALLHFEGSVTDDWNANTWATNNASFSSGIFKFGTQSLRLSGSASYCQTVNIHNPGQSNWTIDTWVNLDSNVNASIFSLANSFGIYVSTNGSGHPQLWLSSTGMSWDIAAGSAGGSVVSAATWHHFALTFDGTSYRLFLDGVNQVTVATSNPLIPLQSPIVFPECTGLALGYQIGAATGYTAGYWDEFSLVPYARWVANFTPPSAPYTVAGDWFDTNQMVMKTATAPGPVWTPIQRMYVAEVQTGASSITGTFPYSATTSNAGFNFNAGNFKVKAGKKVYYAATPEFVNLAVMTPSAQNTFIVPPSLVPPDATCFYVQCQIFHAPINGSNYQDIAFVTRLPIGVAQNFALLGAAFALYSGMGTANVSLAFTESAGTQTVCFPLINGVASFEGMLNNVSAPGVNVTIALVLLGYDLP